MCPRALSPRCAAALRARLRHGVSSSHVHWALCGWIRGEAGGAEGFARHDDRGGLLPRSSLARFRAPGNRVVPHRAGGHAPDAPRVRSLPWPTASSCRSCGGFSSAPSWVVGKWGARGERRGARGREPLVLDYVTHRPICDRSLERLKVGMGLWKLAPNRNPARVRDVRRGRRPLRSRHQGARQGRLDRALAFVAMLALSHVANLMGPPHPTPRSSPGPT